MGEFFITSDLHLNHCQSFLWEPRGFTSVEEMNEAIIERWNKVVKPEDTIYNLGDLAMNNIETAIPYIKRLNGFQWWIRGNHCTLNKVKRICEECKNISLISNPEASWATMFKYGKIICYLSHYPTLTANFDSGKHFSQHVINFHGHTHSKEKWEFDTPFTYNVGMDAHNCYPIPIDLAIEDIRNKFIMEK